MKRLLPLLLILIALFAACSPLNQPAPTPSSQSGLLPSLAVAATLQPDPTGTIRPTDTAVPPTPLPTHTPEPSYCDLLQASYQPPAGFQNYCDARYGFAIDYPESYFSAPSNPGSQSLLGRVMFSAQGMTNYLEIDTFAMPEGSTLEKQAEQHWTYPYREITDKPYDIRIGGQPAIAILNRWHQDYSQATVFFQHGAYYYVIAVKAISESGLETNWQMVSSIQVKGVPRRDNAIPDDLIEDSYRLINPILVPQP